MRSGDATKVETAALFGNDTRRGQGRKVDDTHVRHFFGEVEEGNSSPARSSPQAFPGCSAEGDKARVQIARVLRKLQASTIPFFQNPTLLYCFGFVVRLPACPGPSTDPEVPLRTCRLSF